MTTNRTLFGRSIQDFGRKTHKSAVDLYVSDKKAKIHLPMRAAKKVARVFKVVTDHLKIQT
ncbi:hypothetical protein BSG1_03090 [Bacillus sp. SG-1]|nr:hypothetical protein BSG1_03090 [Bacillus sp. SG-1]